MFHLIKIFDANETKIVNGFCRNDFEFLHIDIKINNFFHTFQLRGMNGLFGLKIQITVGETVLVGIAVSLVVYFSYSKYNIYLLVSEKKSDCVLWLYCKYQR